MFPKAKFGALRAGIGSLHIILKYLRLRACQTGSASGILSLGVICFGFPGKREDGFCRALARRDEKW